MYTKLINLLLLLIALTDCQELKSSIEMISISTIISSTIDSSPTVSPTIDNSLTISSIIKSSPTVSSTVDNSLIVSSTVGNSLTVSSNIDNILSVSPTIDSSPTNSPTIDNSPTFSSTIDNSLTVSTPKKELLQKHVHIAIGDDLSEMVIVWSERQPTNQTAVLYGSDRQPGEYTNIETGYSLVLENGDNVQYIHYVTLKNLTPNVRYKYKVGSSGVWSEEGSFTTLRTDTNWVPKVAIYGDLGWEGTPNSIPNLIDMANREAFDFVIHIGDIAYELFSYNGTIGDGFLNAIEPLASKMPYMVVPGNHEYWSGAGTDLGYNYKRRFKMPQNNDNEFYTLQVGKALLVAFSTEYYFELSDGSIDKVNKQKQWLEQVLTQANKPENRAKQPWIIALAHRSLYCSTDDIDCIDGMTIDTGDFDTKTLELEEILHRQGVDVAFWGHYHYYDRLLPVYNRTWLNSINPYVNPFTTVHIVSGSAGMGDGGEPLTDPPPPWSAFRSNQNGYTIMNVVNETHLYLKQIDIKSPKTSLDSVWIVQQNHRTRDTNNLFNAKTVKPNFGENLFANQFILINFILINIVLIY